MAEQLSNLIANIYLVSITLGTDEITKVISFRDCNIYEGIDDLIPTCTLRVYLPIDLVNQSPSLLMDGAKITINIQTKSDFEMFQMNETYNFRLCGVDDIQIDSYFINCTIYGIFDCYKLFEDGNQYNAKANSSEIVCKIAGACGLQCEKDGTSDKQLWIAGEKNARDFIKYMAKYGYIDGTSGIFWCVTKEKKLLYKNIIKAFNGGCSGGNCKAFIPAAGPGGENKTSSDQSQKQAGQISAAWTYSTISTNLKNGDNNINHGGYGGKDNYFKLKDYKLEKASCNQNCACSGCCNISKELSQGLNSVWPGFDVGNHYNNYFKAAKQNERVLASFSTELNAFCQFLQPIKVGEVLNVVYSYTYYNSEEKIGPFKTLSGKALVSSNRIELSPAGASNYVTLVMQGIQTTDSQREEGGSY